MQKSNDFLAVFLLFWPAVASVFFLGFVTVAGILFFIGGAVLIFSIFTYGAYALLRDFGYLDWLFRKLFLAREFITETVKNNVQKSFLFEQNAKIPKGTALYICHPHGLYALSWFLHFSLGLTDWPSSSDSKPVLAVHSIFFKIPFVRELFEQHSCIEAKEETIYKTLQNGKSVALLVGGIEELQATKTGTMRLILKKRKGYARIAKKAGVPLVPLLTVGENELFPVSENYLWSCLQSFLYSKFHIALPLPQWKSLFSWGKLIYSPFSKPLVTHILQPIEHTSRKSQKEIRDEYLETLLLFGKNQNLPLEIM